MHTARCSVLAAAAAAAWLAGCGPQGTPATSTPKSASSASTPAPDAPASPSAPRDKSLVSLDDSAALQVYYQYVDERGRVRFVSTLAEVPAEWRSRVGFVEMSSPPPGSPAEAQRLRDARTARVSRPSARDGGVVGGHVEVILYSADWCGVCTRAKRYMDDKGIPYDERNVDESEWKEEMQAKAGPGGIPVFDVNGQILRGFSPERLEQLIAKAS